MKVSQLIEALQNMPQDAEVLTHADNHTTALFGGGDTTRVGKGTQGGLPVVLIGMRPFTRADLNKTVRVIESGEIGTVMNIDLDSGRVLVSGLNVRWWFAQKDVERGRVVETWEPEE